MIETPTGSKFTGVKFRETCAVSIMRSGEAIEQALRTVTYDISLGKVLVQRDPNTSERKLLYSTLPKNLKRAHVLVLDPIMASGSAAMAAIKHITENGVKQKNITFVTMLTCPEGVMNVLKAFPRITIATSMLDDGLDDKKLLIPGIGDFADRYFGT